jgi:hypothetical protein
MYEIKAWDDGTTVATVRLDPYRFDVKEPNRNGLRSILNGVEDRGMMTGDPPDDEDSTSLEGYEEPTDDFLLDTIAMTVAPGHALVEANAE